MSEAWLTVSFQGSLKDTVPGSSLGLSFSCLCVCLADTSSVLYLPNTFPELTFEWAVQHTVL